jgi:anti-sigma-K factor RskA
MRASPSLRDESSLEMQLARLEAQLREFEAALRAQQQRHGHVRTLEADLAGVVDRGAALVRELSGIRDELRQTVEAATRGALAASGARLEEFERRAARILDAYATAVRAAQQAVARAEARIDAFDERVGRELAQAGREIREAATLLRERGTELAVSPVADGPVPHARRLIPALLAAALLLGALAAYAWVARTVRDASARADAAERQAHETQREAKQQIASIERSAQQASRDALSSAARAERMVSVLAAPDARRTVLFGQPRAVSASGQALWSPSRGVVATATGLPSLAATDTYQVWLVTPRGSISLGFLAPDAAGRATDTFDLPPDIAGSIRGFMVTREPTGGSARPSRTVVLAS